MENLFYTTPKYLQNLKGIESSASEIDAVVKAGGGGSSSSEGDMLKSIYDTNSNGIVDNAEKVNNLTVETAVPIDAVFTDTVYDDTALSDRVSDLENSDFVIDANYVHTDNNFTDTLKNKLDGIDDSGIMAGTIEDFEGALD